MAVLPLALIENPRQPALLFDSICLAADFRLTLTVIRKCECDLLGSFAVWGFKLGRPGPSWGRGFYDFDMRAQTAQKSETPDLLTWMPKR